MRPRPGEATIEIEGADLFCLDREAGGHRIQRIPPTERRGRVHSSTVTIAVINPLEIRKIEFNDRDFRVEWYSGSGAGGQHRNKHQNSCRITHIPSNVVATAQTRSRQSSLQLAKNDILNRLNKFQIQRAYDTMAIDRKIQVGSGERGDKIRTYRFQDNIVKDHRSEKSAALDKVMSGNFQLLW